MTGPDHEDQEDPENGNDKAPPLRKAKGAYHHGNLREALVEAAALLLAREGLDGLSLRGVAREAGVSQAAPYRHFEDREALLAALALRGFADLMARMEEAAKPYADWPEEAVVSVGGAYVRFAVAEPALFRLMFGRDIRNRSKYETLRDATTRIARHTGRVLNNPALGLGIWAAMHGLAWLLIEGVTDLGQGEDTAIIPSRAEVVLRGILRGAPGD